jgi:hypothetical protein
MIKAQPWAFSLRTQEVLVSVYVERWADLVTLTSILRARRRSSCDTAEVERPSYEVISVA